MAIGGHELLLIVRAQNQASAALGRVARDIRRLETQRDLAARRAALANRAAQQNLRIMQTESQFGSRNVAIRGAQLRVENQIAAVHDRAASIEQRRAAILGRANQILRQEEALRVRIKNLDGEALSIETRRLRIEQQLAKTRASIAALQPGGLGRQQALLNQYRAQTSILRNELTRDIQRARLKALRSGADPQRIAFQKRRVTISTRDVEAARRSYAIASGSVKQLDAAIRDLRRSEGIQINALKELEQETIALAEKERLLRGQIVGLQDAWNSLSAREKVVQGAEAQHIRQLNQLQIELQGVTARALEAGQAAQFEREQMRLTNIELANMNRLVAAQRWENFATGARAVSHLGRVMQLFGLVSTAALGYAAKASADFGNQIVLAATQSTTAQRNTVEQVQKNAAVIQNAIQNMLAGGNVTANAQEQADAIYEIFSGVSFAGTQAQQLQQGIKVLKEFNQVAKANYGIVSLNEVTKAGIILMNDFNLSTSQLPRTLNTLQAAVRFARVNMSEFLSTFNQAVPAAKAAGYSFQDMSAALVFLSRRFPSVSRGATSYARLLDILANRKFITGLKAQGVTITDNAGRLLPLDQVIGRIVKRFPELRKGGTILANFFKQLSGQTGTIQARRAFTFFVQGLEQYRRDIRNVAGDQNELAKSARAVERFSPAANWAELVNQAHALALIIGREAIPAFVQLGRPFVNLLHYFNSLSPSTKRLIAEILTWGSALTLIGGTLLTVVGGMASLILRAVEMRKWLASLRGETAALAGEAGAISVRLALGLGIAAAIPLLIKYHDQVNRIVQAMGGWDRVIRLIGATLLALPLLRIISRLSTLAISSSAVSTELAAVGGSAEVAAGRAALLRTRLLALARIGVIAIAIDLVFNKEDRNFIFNLKDHIENGFRAARNAATKYSGAHFLFNALHLPGADYMPTVEEERLKKRADEIARTLRLSTRQREIPGYGKGYLVTDRNGNLLLGPFASEQEAYKHILNYSQIAKALQEGAADAARQSSEAGRNINRDIADARRAVIAHNKMTQAQRIKAAARPAEIAAAAVKAQRDAQTFIRLIIEARRVAERSPTIEHWRRYYRLQDALAKRFKGAELQAIQEVISAQESATKKAVSGQTQAIDVMRQAVDNLRQQYDQFLQSNQQAFGQLFQGPFIQSPVVQNRLEWGQVLNTGDLTRDLRSQVKQFETWRRSIDRLRNRGLPPGLIAQIQELGPAAQKQIDLLLRMTPRQLRAYSALWQRGQRDIQRATMEDLRQHLNQYRKFGRQVALAIIAGLRDEHGGLRKALVAMINEIYGRGGRDRGRSNAPRPAPSGAQTRRAAQTRRRQPPPPAPRTTAPRTPRRTPSRPRVTDAQRSSRHTQASVQHFHYHVEGAQEMSPQTQLRKMYFKMRNGPPGGRRV